jgi:hypothetical protein
MRKILALAAGVSLVAAAAHAQLIDPTTGRPYGAPMPAAPSASRQPDITRPLPSTQSTKPLPSFGPSTLPRLPTFNPPREPNVATAHPFSPAGEAARERKENAMPQGGPFSPEGEARREKAQAKHDKEVTSPF